MILDQMGVTLLVVDVLERLQVPYLIGGSLASNLHGTARATLDTDLVALMRLEHAEPFAQALVGTFYVDVEAIKDAIYRHRCFNVIHLETIFKVDVFIPPPGEFTRAQFARRVYPVVASNPERHAYVASAEDTILAKLIWYQMGGGVSERQWRDILEIMMTAGQQLDWDYLRQWAATLEVDDLLTMARSAAGISAE